MYNTLKKDICTTQEVLQQLNIKVTKREKERKNIFDMSTLQYAALSAKLSEI